MTHAATADQLAKYEVVIGLEVHVQLATNTKIFCGCPTSFGAPPNTNVCPVCLGLPGALPVMSKPAVDMAILGALALNCTINPTSRMARKNYFYPDLPKGYQISQYELPLAEHGFVDVVTGKGTKRIGVTRVHMEDDAGKSIHDGFKDSDRFTYVDLNRSGTPLIEIVSEPDMRSADEAYEYMTYVKQAMEFLEVSSCDMEKGHLRCDANVSVRKWGVKELGTKAEIKNLNSFRFLKLAIEFEVGRQVAIVDSGGKIVQETRLYNPDLNETFSMRSKEAAHDYRYFPEPDLVPIRISDGWRDRLRATMPELPAQKRLRYATQFGLNAYDTDVLTATKEIGAYYEKAVATSGDAKITANWVMGDLMALLKAEDKEITASPISAEDLGDLVKRIVSGELSGKLAKEIFPKMYAEGLAPGVIIERDGLKQISDTGAIEKIIDDVLAANPKQVEQYKSGKTTVIGFLVGQIMKATKGQANPGVVNDLLKAKLG